jgi:hypothetical protein
MIKYFETATTHHERKPKREPKPRKAPLTDAEKAAKKFERKAKKYGMTVEQQRALEVRPCCDICGRKPLPGKSLYTDHDHKTGRVRGRLCFTCNYRLLGKGALGRADLHRKAADYLESLFDARTCPIL